MKAQAELHVGVRWTVGDICEVGFEALQASIWGLWRIFGPRAAYTVCVNTIEAETARALTGEVPEAVTWQQVDETLPDFFQKRLGPEMAEGTAWKFLPLRAFPHLHEISLDNDCVLWNLPKSVAEWLEREDRCLIASDMKTCFGQFASFCGPEPRNAGIRGFPPGFDFEAALRQILSQSEAELHSETDEQGLQVAALSTVGEPIAVSVEDVTICSAFPMHTTRLGRCGAHFVGLNMKQCPWTLEGEPITNAIRRNWRSHYPKVRQKVGLPLKERSEKREVRSEGPVERGERPTD